MLGSKYLIMKEEYWDNKENNIEDKNGVLITTGGSDEHEIAVEIMDIIKNSEIKVRLIIGPGYREDYIKRIECAKNDNVELIYSPSSLKKYISESEIVITAGGSTIYEVMSQKSTPIIFSLADNQDLICEELTERGVLYLRKYPKISYDTLKDIIEEIKEGNNNYKDNFDLVDGRGALRVCKTILHVLDSGYNYIDNQLN